MAVSVVALALLAAPAAQSAAERASNDDVVLTISLANGPNPVPQTTTSGLAFRLAFQIDDTAGHAQDVTLMVTLPDGLHWGNDAPNPSEGCTGSGSISCTSPLRPNEAGGVDGGWIWDVIADRAGTFEVTATATPSEPDPNPTNNTFKFQFDVQAPPPASPTATGASLVTVAPARPRAGTTLSASVRVQGGRPAGIRCHAATGNATLVGKGSATGTTATCRFRTPRTARGKALRGAVSFRIGSKTFSRRFSTRLH